MERPFAVPLGYVEKVDRRERSFAVPFGHVTERVNAEGVKPLPYGRWFTGTVMLLVDGLVPFLLLMLRIFVVWDGLLRFRLVV